MIKNLALGAAAIATGIGYGMLQNHTFDSVQKHPDMAQEHPYREEIRNNVDSLATVAKKKYKISDDLANHIAFLAKKHEKADFPKAKDIMAIVGIESSFNPNAKSGLKIDPARGLTQIRPKVWGLNQTDLDTPEKQISKGAEILATYHQKFKGDVAKAIHAYNVGETNIRKGTGLNPKYVEKFNQERKLYED